MRRSASVDAASLASFSTPEEQSGGDALAAMKR